MITSYAFHGKGTAGLSHFVALVCREHFSPQKLDWQRRQNEKGTGGNDDDYDDGEDDGEGDE